MATAEATDTNDDTGRFRAIAGTVAAIALVHLALLVVVPDGPELLVLVVAEGLVLALLVGIDAVVGDNHTVPVGLAGTYLLFVVGTWALLQATSLTVATLTLVGGLSLVAYGLHRYELVTLGLVEESP